MTTGVARDRLLALTLYFFRQNMLGIHESSGKAMKIMMATTVMAVVILVWCGVTLAVKGVAKNAMQPRSRSCPI